MKCFCVEKEKKGYKLLREVETWSLWHGLCCPGLGVQMLDDAVALDIDPQSGYMSPVTCMLSNSAI